MNLANLKIRTKLSLGFGIVLALLVAIIGLSLYSLHSLNAQTDAIVGIEWEKSKASVKVLDNLRGSIGRVFQAVSVTDDAMRKSAKERLAANQKAYGEGIAALEKMLTREKGKAILAQMRETRTKYDSLVAKTVQLADESQAFDARTLAFGETYDALHAFAKNARDMNDFLEKNLDTMGVESAAEYRTTRNLVLVLGLAAVLLGLYGAYMVSNAITGPINEAVRFAETVAEGDLRTEVTVRHTDETGNLLRALGAMNENLVKIVGQVRTGTETMSTAASEIASGNLDLSQRTEEQASSLEETASAMEELTSTVRQNADNARQANQLAISASEVAVRGGGVVADVVNTMASINESSKKIVDIISVIDGIAFQTNILALNAAVEAARAGEQGRGFAVVAAEVRNLAQRSAAAAKEIKGLITDSVEKVENGTRLVDQAGTTMDEVVTSIRRVTDIVAEIASASDEQSDGIGQVNMAITQMDTATQQNAALVEEAAAAAGAMTDQAQGLAQLVSTFKLTPAQLAQAGGAQATTRTRPAAKPAPRPAARPAPKLAVVKPAAPKLAATSAAPAGNSGEDWEEF